MEKLEDPRQYLEMESPVDNIEYNPGKETMWWGTLGTMRPFQPFDPDLDARQIFVALENKTVDMMTLTRILTNRTNAQRQNIAVAYHTLAHKDLNTVLKKALSGPVQELLLALLMTPAQFDAHRLRHSMEGLGTDEEALLEVLCTRSADQLRDITVEYKQAYGRYLENDLISETSKDFTKLVLAILKKEELNTPGQIDYQLIAQDVKSLEDAVRGKKPDPAPWIQVLTSRNLDHLNRVLSRLEDVTGEVVDKTVQSHFSGDLRLGLHTLVRSIQNTPLYLAQRLQASMKKNAVVRGIMVGRSEEDLLWVRVCFRKLANASLYSTIQKEFKGDLQLALLGLCRSEDI
ncbi:annexin A2-like [Salminus brasiliensis]|uniref:annexin A2-like n=1 Tax=Salminus brasiliensis TaxID=930266 RepID=UPI003B837DF0